MPLSYTIYGPIILLLLLGVVGIKELIRVATNKQRH